MTTCSAPQAQSRPQEPRYELTSDWAALIITGSKTKKASGTLHNQPPKDKNGLMHSQILSHKLEQEIGVQQQKAQFIASGEPF